MWRPDLYKHTRQSAFLNIAFESLLRYVYFEPSFKLRWCSAQDLFWITNSGNNRRFWTTNHLLNHYAIRNWWVRYLHHMYEVRSTNPPVVTGICDPSKCQVWNHRSLLYRPHSVKKLGKLIDIVMGNIFRKYLAWFGGLSLRFRLSLIYQPITINKLPNITN